MEVEEPQFQEGTKRLRPFARRAEVINRSYLLPLQRVVTDFGADLPFGQVPEKVKEHYGVDIGASAARRITEGHARVFYEKPALGKAQPIVGCSATIIAQTDGGMVPIVQSDPDAQDKRKGKTLEWREVKICLAHRHESRDMAYGGTFSGGASEVGQAFHHCVMMAGFDKKHPLHVVGDGALWITNQVEAHFGAQGHYLIDFYHVCEYLAAAAVACSTQPEVWMEQQKSALKSNQVSAVLAALLPHIEAPSIDDKDAPVRCAHRYLRNRRKQLDYKGAIEKKLPIGSGEIESAHRYLVQQRLKRAGSWWAPANVDCMLALRLARANGRWHGYWNSMPTRCAA